MFEQIKEKAKNLIKDIARETFDEMKPKHEETEVFGCSLPELDRNKYLALSLQKTHADLSPIMPAGVAMDSACDLKAFNGAYNISNPVSDIIYTHFATQGFIGFQACAILCQNWIINKACAQPPKDAIRPSYELSYVTTDEESLDKDFLSEITDISNDCKGFDIKEVAKTFAEKKRQFGQILAYPIVDDVDYEQPFNIDGIKPNSYKGMTVVDPIWYQAILDEEAISDPTSLRYFKPTYFQLPSGKKIHYSWCIFATNGDMPDVLKPTYRWGGYPVPQLIYQRVYSAERVANEAPMLAQSKRLLVADINVNSYFANPQQTEKQLQVLSNFRDNWGVMTKRPGDSVQQIDTSLTDLDEVIMTQYQLVAAAASIPATKLLETQPKGFNSTGDYEDDQYKLTLVSIQEDDFVPLLDFHYALLSKSKYGIVRDYTINFKEIDTPTEKERAEINEIKARTDSTYVQAGVISPDEVRDSLVKDPNSGYNNLTGEAPEEEEINFFEEQEGNGEIQQDPFSLDKEWKEEEHPRKDNGQFGEGNGKVENSSKYDKIKNKQRPEIKLPKEEYAQVMHELNTNLTKEQQQKKHIRKAIGNNIYTVVNKGFNEYKIIGKISINDLD